MEKHNPSNTLVDLVAKLALEGDEINLRIILKRNFHVLTIDLIIILIDLSNNPRFSLSVALQNLLPY